MFFISWLFAFKFELDGGTKPRPIQEKILAQNEVQTPRKRRAKPSPTKEGRRKGKTEPNKEERGRAKSRTNGGENGLKTESESAENGF